VSRTDDVLFSRDIYRIAGGIRVKWRETLAFASLVTAIVTGLSPVRAPAADQSAGTGRPVASLSEDDLNRYREEIQKNSAALAEYRKLLDEARGALAEYRKALADRRPADNATEETRKKILEVLANAGLAVAAIFFGFFGLLVGALPGTEDPRVRTIYWRAALSTGVGVLVALSTSIFAILGLSNISSPAAAWSIGLAVCTGLLVLGVTVSFIVTLLRT
jgi:hypothetical protein